MEPICGYILIVSYQLYALKAMADVQTWREEVTLLVFHTSLDDISSSCHRLQLSSLTTVVENIPS